jgi:hypothetical protein
MSRKLAISNTVMPEVVAVIKDGDQPRRFKFSLVCTRKDTDSLKEDLKRDDYSVSDFLKEVTTGWEGQRLVLEEDGTPSTFGSEAFDELLSIAGMPSLCLAAYLKEVVAKEKN